MKVVLKNSNFQVRRTLPGAHSMDKFFSYDCIGDISTKASPPARVIFNSMPHDYCDSCMHVAFADLRAVRMMPTQTHMSELTCGSALGYDMID